MPVQRIPSRIIPRVRVVPTYFRCTPVAPDAECVLPLVKLDMCVAVAIVSVHCIRVAAVNFRVNCVCSRVKVCRRQARARPEYRLNMHLLLHTLQSHHQNRTDTVGSCSIVSLGNIAKHPYRFHLYVVQGSDA